MLKKLFGGKKSAYFLELDESQKPEPAKEKKAEEKKAQAPSKPVEVKKAEPSKATEAPKAETAAKNTKKTSVKDKAKTEPTQAKPEPKASKPTISDPEEIVRAAVFKNSSNNGNAASQTNGFAANNVIVPTMSRRRPGPSLNMFKNMARQAKTPKK
jgi:hypothetical protein